MRTNRVIAAAAASLIAATGLVACSSETDTASSSDGDTVTVKIGTTDADLKALSDKVVAAAAKLGAELRA